MDRDTSSVELSVFHDLLGLAYFFAMRSCEYLLVRDNKERRTDPIRKEDIIFIKDHRILPHTAPNIGDADSVSLNFTIQKNFLSLFNIHNELDLY